MKCKGVGSLIQTLRGFGALEDASWCEEEERVLGVRMPWGSPQLWGLGSEEERCKRCWRSAGRGGWLSPCAVRGFSLMEQGETIKEEGGKEGGGQES